MKKLLIVFSASLIMLSCDKQEITPSLKANELSQEKIDVLSDEKQASIYEKKAYKHLFTIKDSCFYNTVKSELLISGVGPIDGAPKWLGFTKRWSIIYTLPDYGGIRLNQYPIASDSLPNTFLWASDGRVMEYSYLGFKADSGTYNFIDCGKNISFKTNLSGVQTQFTFTKQTIDSWEGNFYVSPAQGAPLLHLQVNATLTGIVFNKNL